MKRSVSKPIFLTTISIAVLRDAITDDTNLELYAFICTGMLVALIAYLLFDLKAADKAEK